MACFAARDLLRFAASALVVLERDSGITGGVSAGTGAAVRLDAFRGPQRLSIDAILVRRVRHVNEIRRPLSIAAGSPCRCCAQRRLQRFGDLLDLLRLEVWMHRHAQHPGGGSLCMGETLR